MLTGEAGEWRGVVGRGGRRPVLEENVQNVEKAITTMRITYELHFAVVAAVNSYLLRFVFFFGWAQDEL